MTKILDNLHNAEVLRNFVLAMAATSMKKAVKAKARREYNRNIHRNEEWHDLNTRISMSIHGVKG